MDDGVDRITGQWAVERPELDTDPMAIFGRIFRLSALSGERMEREYGSHGLSRADFDVLATLRRHGPPFQLSPGALSATLMLTTGGMTSRLDRLERAGWITRSPSATDRRSLLVTLTDVGRATTDEAVVTGLDAQRAMLDGVPARDRRKLDELLRRLLASVEAGVD